MTGCLKRSWAPAPSGIVDMARGAGVEERSVKETAGKGADYGDLDTAVGWLLKPRLLSQDMGALVKLGAEGHFRPDLTDGRLTIASV